MEYFPASFIIKIKELQSLCESRKKDEHNNKNASDNIICQYNEQVRKISENVDINTVKQELIEIDLPICYWQVALDFLRIFDFNTCFLTTQDGERFIIHNEIDASYILKNCKVQSLAVYAPIQGTKNFLQNVYHC